jgi:proteasome lid subunit RPN8/RPN11
VAPSVIEDVVNHARHASPAECCGLLVGTGGTVVQAVPARNLADDPTRRFLVDPRDHLDSRRRAREAGREVVGFYHSHPRGDATPSPTDLAEASDDDWLYMIVGLGVQPSEVRMFRLQNRRFVEVAVEQDSG